MGERGKWGRRFYTNAPALLQLYLSLVRPHLEYASDVWDPPPSKGQSNHIECPEVWTKDLCQTMGSGLLTNFELPALQFRRLHHKLCTMFKMVHNLISFPSSIFVPRPSRYHHNTYFQLFAHTNSFLYSFVPNTISAWNLLPGDVKSALTLPVFNAHALKYFK